MTMEKIKMRRHNKAEMACIPDHDGGESAFETLARESGNLGRVQQPAGKGAENNERRTEYFMRE